MARIQAALGLIGFSSTSETPSTAPRVLSVVLKDAANGSSVAKTRTVGVTSVNDVPVVTLPSTAIAYVENAVPLLVFTGATAVDVDLAAATSTTATLTITNTNGESTDRLSIVPSGVYSVVGSELRANGVAIATFTGGAGTTPLVLSFTTNMARIQATLGLIGFSSTSETPSTTPRVLSVVLKDVVNGSSVAKTRTVGVTSVNDVPVVTLPTTAIAYVENAGPLLVFTGATAIDADLAASTASTATLTITNTNGESTDRLSIVPSGVYSVVGSELRANVCRDRDVYGWYRNDATGPVVHNQHGKNPSDAWFDWFFEYVGCSIHHASSPVGGAQRCSQWFECCKDADRWNHIG